MQNTTKLIVLRHGESIGNAERKILGHTDLDLSPLGYLQAEATAKYLRNEKIDKIYSSDLLRAYNTAVPHAKIRNLEIIKSEKLREAYVGDWEGLNLEQITEKWGRESLYVAWKKNFGTFVFPHGESVKDAGERFYKEIMHISTENIGKTVLIAAHAAVIRGFWSIISGISWKDIVKSFDFPSNASYSIVYFDGERLIPESYSNDAHLVDIGITQFN